MSDAPITDKFRAKAPGMMLDIIQAVTIVPMSDEDAAAALGNVGVETGGLMLRLEEGKPKENQGWGWCQWTGMDPGERRLLFEQWCNANGYDDVVDEPTSSPETRYDAACLGYLAHELNETWEKRVLTEGGAISGVYYPPLKDCPTLDEKTISFMKLFERPGTPHSDWRIEMAHEALRLYRGGKAMPYTSVVISSGHGLYVRGASGILDEVDEARKVADRLADELTERGVDVVVFHDNTSHSQNENLNTIVDAHNDEQRQLDISIHFNAYEQVEKPMGVEVLYITQQKLAADVSAAIASCGFINRGAKKRSDLFFLNNTEEPAILLEVCFVDSEADAAIYRDQFDRIVECIADVIGGKGGEVVEPPPVVTEPPPVTTPVATINIEVAGEVVIFVNGEQVGTKG